ncbi:hypothetical protein MKZ38_007829 [Zalerion maritima]|uniref:Autophagy-related protein 11 n=1 Tax=Zalerion maritima TaxID=339359 RepID=A0AAD5RHA7_9PEZI|nr:hypothetical protein MKZ38_007829 [Zalerion maritima]
MWRWWGRDKPITLAAYHELQAAAAAEQHLSTGQRWSLDNFRVLSTPDERLSGSRLFASFTSALPFRPEQFLGPEKSLRRQRDTTNFWQDPNVATAMSAQVLIAHSGQQLQVDANNQFSSVDEFKAWVSRQCRIPVQNVVALTPSGKTVKAVSALNTETDIYVYDMRIITATSSPSSSLVSESPMPKRYSVSNPPNSIANTSELQAWQELFLARQKWAIKLYDDCTRMAEATQARYEEMDVIMKCLDAAVVNLETVVKPIDGRYTEFKKWAAPTQEEYAQLAANWEHYLSLAQNVPIAPAMVRFMTDKETPRGRQASLEDLIDIQTAEKLGRRSGSSLKTFNKKVSELDESANQMFQGCQDLFREFDIVVNQSVLQHSGDAAQLQQDIEPLASKVDTDYQTTMQYTNSNRDILQASKMAATHTERHLPRLRERALEMDSMLRYAIEKRNTLASGSLEFMRIIAEISTLQGSVKSQMQSLTQGVDEMNTFDYLRLIQQLPFMYAAFVAESIRRREWTDKMKSDSITLANEMALFQDEETKRRRKWQKMVGQTYGPEIPSSSVLGLEVNLRGDSDTWPDVTKDDLSDFLDMLHRIDAEPEVIADVQKLLAELSTPTKQQTKRLKAFKNGSVHEAALGRSGLLIRGDNDLMQSLQDDKARLESKVKTAESRVRRLEGLLHQQSQASRPSLGNVFSTPSQHLSERNDSTASVRSPRIPEDRQRSSDANEALLQTVQRLEAELTAEKQKTASLETDNTSRAAQLDEVNSTKKDLLGNMEALQREFDVERKSLEDEIRMLKARIEDNEDEIEHFGESRENEKATYDEKVQVLEHEVECLKKERNDEFLKSQGQVEFLRNESRLQRERNNSLDRELQASHEATNNLIKKLGTVEEQTSQQAKALGDIHIQLSGDAGPNDVAELIDAVSNKSSEMLTKIQDVERDISLLKSDLEQEQGTSKHLRAELAEIKEKYSEAETNSLKTKETLAEEKARSSTLEQELLGSREQLSELRARLTDGETGSESLRKRLEDNETHVSSLTEKLAAKQSQVGSLEEELLLYKERAKDAQDEVANVTNRLEGRTERAKDLTQRLYNQNDRLCRLLERLGFSVTRQGSTMVIQKIPRSERITMQNAGDSSDPNSSIRKSTTLHHSKPLADSTDLELLHWMNSEDPATEARNYDAYLQALGHFDMDVLSETVYKRMKDVEHIARKLQRDVRSYREKAHNYQKESHEKIAFKNFKEGDLALFLPTRNQTTGAWAAFNVGFPHYFLREQEGHRLRSREWLVARINKVEERVVDLSRSLHQPAQNGPSSETDSLRAEENDNPFDLSDGLRWYLIDAQEDKPGAPFTPGQGKSTVVTNAVEAMAERHPHHARQGSIAGAGGSKHKPSPSSIEGVSKALSKSLETRRSSTSSKKGLPFSLGGGGGGGAGSNRNSAVASETNSLRAVPSETPAGTSPTAQHTGEGFLRRQSVHRTVTTESNKPDPPTTTIVPEGKKTGGENDNETLLVLSRLHISEPQQSPSAELMQLEGSSRRNQHHPLEQQQYQQQQRDGASGTKRRTSKSPKKRWNHGGLASSVEAVAEFAQLSPQKQQERLQRMTSQELMQYRREFQQQQQQQQQQTAQLRRQESSNLTNASETPSKRSVVWESLWSMDLGAGDGYSRAGGAGKRK